MLSTKAKKLFLSFFILFAGFVLVACGGAKNSGQDAVERIQADGELMIGTSPDYPPMEFYVLDENRERQIVGSDIALAQAIADELGVALEITPTDFNGVMANVQSGSVDMGISGFTWTEARDEVMQFSEGYLQETTLGYQGVMMQEDLAQEFDSLEEIAEADLTIGAQVGSIQFELAQLFTEPTDVKQYGTLDVGLAALNEGDIDAMVVSTSSAAPMLDTFPNLTILPQEDFDLDPDKKYSTNAIAFPLGEEYESLIEVANQVIRESKENGDIEKWHEEALAISEKSNE